jgi:hypothetical protein
VSPPAGSGLQDLDSNGSINSSTALRSPSAGGVTDSDDTAAAAAAVSKAHDSSVADGHLLQTASRLAVHLMVSAGRLYSSFVASAHALKGALFSTRQCQKGLLVVLLLHCLQLVLCVPSNTTTCAVLTCGMLAPCLQTLLDWHQLAYLIFSAAAPLTARGASMLLALLLTTPQSTLGWVPMDCLVAAGRAGHAAAAASIVSSVYPGG